MQNLTAQVKWLAQNITHTGWGKHCYKIPIQARNIDSQGSLLIITGTQDVWCCHPSPWIKLHWMLFSLLWKNKQTKKIPPTKLDPIAQIFYLTETFYWIFSSLHFKAEAEPHNKRCILAMSQLWCLLTEWQLTEVLHDLEIPYL